MTFNFNIKTRESKLMSCKLDLIYDLCMYDYFFFPSLFLRPALSEGGGQTQDGLSLLCGCGNRLWDNLQRLRIQLHTRLGGHTHDEVRVIRSPKATFSQSPHMNTALSHWCRRWEGGDPGVANQKSPTCLLLTPELRFHSFGFAARDFYHDLDPEEARHWLYFDKFKMKIHSTSVRKKKRSQVQYVFRLITSNQLLSRC